MRGDNSDLVEVYCMAWHLTFLSEFNLCFHTFCLQLLFPVIYWFSSRYEA
jgi:hypothetical protein